MTLLELSECRRLTGVSVKTLYRWIAAKKLKRRKDGRVSLSDVERLKASRRTGRKYAPSELERIYAVRDSQALASPFLSPSRGLVLLESVMGVVISRHLRIPGARKNMRAMFGRLYALL